MRDLVLTVGYWLAIKVRVVLWWVLRPKAMGVRALVVREVESGQVEVLLVRHRAGRDPWGLPGGGVEHNEPLTAAVLREVREEAGCTAQIERLHGLFYHFEGGFSNHITVFACTASSPLQPPIGDLEIVTARFFRLNALPHGIDPGSLQRVTELGCAKRDPIFGPWYDGTLQKKR